MVKKKKKKVAYKIGGRVAVQKRNAPQAPMGQAPRGPLTSTKAVMDRMMGGY